MTMGELLELCQGKYTREDIVEMEFNILMVVEFGLELPTLDKYLEVQKIDGKFTREEEHKMMFWLESMVLFEPLSDSPERECFLDILGFITEGSIKSKWMEDLVQFVKSSPFKYVERRYKSHFDVDGHLKGIV